MFVVVIRGNAQEGDTALTRHGIEGRVLRRHPIPALAYSFSVSETPEHAQALFMWDCTDEAPEPGTLLDYYGE